MQGSEIEMPVCHNVAVCKIVQNNWCHAWATCCCSMHVTRSRKWLDSSCDVINTIQLIKQSISSPSWYTMASILQCI